MKWTAEQALDHWQRTGLLTKKKADELHRSLEDAGADVRSRAIGIFSAVGGTLIGLGVMLFVASNWAAMTPITKVTILVLSLLATGGAGYALAFEVRRYVRTGLALLLVNALLFGASIFLVGQIFHLPLHFWWGALLWFLGVAYFAYVLQSRLHLWLAVPLLLLTIGWLRAGSVTGLFSEFEVIFDPQYGLPALFSSIGVGLVGISVMHRRWTWGSFGNETLFHWGCFLVILPAVIASADESVFYQYFRLRFDTFASVIVGVTALAVALGLGFGRFGAREGRGALAALAAYTIFTYIIAAIPQWMGFPMGWETFSMDGFTMVTGLFILHIILAFVLLLSMVWYGTLLKEVTLINMGMIGIAFIIFLQYVSWAFELLDRSVAFILGGVLILIVSAVLERKRRSILSSIE